MPKTRTAEIDLTKLCEATRAARLTWQPFREFRLETVRKYAGEYWTPETSYQPRPINFISLYLSTVPRLLVSSTPKFSLKTFEKKYRAVSAGLELWGNDELERGTFAEVLHRATFDSLIGPFGIVKVGLTTPAESEMSGWGMEFGQPGYWHVDIDDWAQDPHARTMDECAWMGFRQRVMLNSLKGSKLYDAIKKKKLDAEVDRQYNETGDERIGMLSRGYYGNETEVYDYCYLWQYYIPREKLIVTLYSDDGYGPRTEDYKGTESAFEQKDWVGPSCGPFHFLRQMLVPGQAMGKGPVQDIVRMDEELNGLYQKLIDQAARQKDITFYQNEKDAERIRDEKDGGMVRVDNPDKIKPVSMGGANAGNQAFAMGMWGMLNKVAGNLELLAGLGQQASTATQEKLLNSNSSRIVTDMQQTTVKFTSDVMKSWLWLAHHHPTKQMTAYHEVPGANVKANVTPAQRRQVPFDALRLQVHPYSFQYQTPQEMMAFIDQTVMQVVTPLMPLLQQQGIFFDVNKYLELKAKYGNCPDLSEVCQFGSNATPSPDTPSSSSQQHKMPVATERSYNRVNRSEKTSQGQDQVAMQQLLSQNAGGRPSNNGSYAGAH